MTVTESFKGSTKILRLSGRLGFYARHIIYQALAKVGQSRESSVVLDLQKVSCLDSAGLVLLIAMLEQLLARNIDLSLVAPEGYVRGILGLGHLEEKFSIHATEEQAMA